MIDILHNCLSVDTVNFGLLVKEEVPEEQVQRVVPPRVVDVALIESIQDLDNVGLPVRIECG